MGSAKEGLEPSEMEDCHPVEAALAGFMNGPFMAAGFADWTNQERDVATLLAYVPGMVYRQLDDPRRSLRLVSAGSLALCGFVAEELIAPSARGWLDLIHPEDRARVAADTRVAFAAGRPYDLIYRVVTATGGVVVVRDRGEGVADARGGCAGWQGCVTEAAVLLHAAAGAANPDAVVIAEWGSGRILEVNPGFEDLAGWTREEVLGRTALELDLWADAAVRAPLLARLGQERRISGIRAQLRRRDGAVHDVIASLALVELSGGAVLTAVMRDTTERNRAEQALRESEQRFAVAFQASPHAMVISELATGRYLEVNASLERMAACARADLLGNTALGLGFWRDPRQRDEVIRRVREEGRLRGVEVGFRNRAGAEVDTVCNFALVDLAGVACLLTAIEDVTERRRAERALRVSEEKFGKAFNASMHSLIISELAPGRFIEVNAGFERIFGYSRDEAIGRTAIELGLWPDPAVREEVVAELRERGSMRARELRFMAKGGRPIVVLLGLELIEIDGTSCVLAAGTDVTAERAAAEEQARLEAQLRQAQKLDALGRLAGGIAHDFNNILTGIMVNAELALMDLPAGDPVGQSLHEVKRAGERARDLVRRILTFSRNQSPERVPLQLAGVVQEALGLLRTSLPPGVECEVRLDADAPLVLADATQIHQVVMNLGINAVHAMRAGRRRLTVTLEGDAVPEGAARGELAPGRYARLTVADTGCGMEAATLARIFEPFFTTKGPGEGTGLGLSVVHGIVEAHDGHITVRSEPGQGSVFEIFLPEHLDVTQVVTGETAAARGRGERLLVVDDEPAVGRALAGLLERMGYVVTWQTDPEAAWQAYRADAYDLVLTDANMPRLTGAELAQRVAGLRPGQAVVLMSGRTANSCPDYLRQLGVCAFLAKPIKQGQLAQVIRSALDARPRP